MTQLIGTIVCIAGIAGLFYLDRDGEAELSPAMWIPTAWLLINGSRAVSMWLHLTPDVLLAQQYTEGSPIDAVIYGVLIVAGVLVLNYRSHSVKRFLRENTAILLFFCYCALSVTWSDDPFIAFKRWSKSVGDLVMVMVVLTDAYPRAAIKRVLTRVAFLLLPLSMLLIMCYPGLGSAYSPEDGKMMYFGVTTFKNLLGMISMVFGLASLWSFIGAYEERVVAHRARHLVAHASVIGVAVGLIVIADSMTSMACMVLAGSAMVLLSQRWVVRRPGGVHVIVCIAVVLPLFALFYDSLGVLVHTLGRSSTLTGRTAIWKAVLSMHTNPLVGTGFESFWLGSRLETVWNMSVRGIQEAHNGYIELYLNLGWMGLLLLIWLVVTGYRNALSVYRYSPQDGRLRLAFLIAALTFSMTEAGFRMLSPIWLAFLLVTAKTSDNSLSKEGGSGSSMLWRRAARPRPIRILQ